MPPTTFGRYTILHTLGAGGMADVYLARDPLLDREVAIKVPRLRSQARFEVEARAVARLEHPAIVPLYEYGEQEGRPFLVMRHMRGGSLADRIARGPRPLAEALPIIERIAAALDYAHSRRVIHRDVKPGNILFDEAGHAFLSDFGIARLEDWGDARGGPRLTAVGAIPGSPAYLSPEQARGARDLDGRSDIYSLGVVVHEMLTGELPQPGAIPTIARRRPDLPAAYQAILARALAADREARYHRAADFVVDLRRAAGGGAQKQPAGLSPWLVIVAGLVVAALVFGYLLLGDGQPPTTGVASPVARTPTGTAGETSTPEDGAEFAEVNLQPSDATSTAVGELPPVVAPTSVAPTAISGWPSMVVLGETSRGTPIEALRFGDGPQKLLFVGGLTGGYAPSASEVARRAADFFTANPDRIPPELTVIVIPLASPDNPLDPGEHRGRLNGNGVDINRNWGCDWTSDPLWDDILRPGSGGEAPFSEAESRLLRDFILSESPAAVVIWYARATNGLVSPGGCGDVSLASGEAADIYGQAAGYKVDDFGDIPGAVVNGDATNWLDSIRFPAVSVLLPSLITVDWQNNLDGMLALLDAYAARPPATPLPSEVVLELMSVDPIPSPAVPPSATLPPLPIAPAVCDDDPGDRWRDTLWDLYQERLICAQNQEVRTSGAFQSFEGGTTIWRQDADRIYVLYNNGTFASYRDDSPGEYPVSEKLWGGFGYLWTHNDAVSDRLGQPLEPEAIAQDFAVQDFRGGVLFYFYENNARNYALFNDNNTWTSIQE